MTGLLERAGTAFLRVFVVTFVFYASGILQAPNKDAAVALAIAALGASIVAALRALQVFVPALSWSALLEQPVAAYADSFTRAFIGTFIVLATGWLEATPDWSDWKAAGFAVIIGAVTAGVRAIQGLLTKGEAPGDDRGF